MKRTSVNSWDWGLQFNMDQGEVTEGLSANVDPVVEKAGMTRSTTLSLRFYTTDMDGFLANYEVYANWVGEAGIRPPQSLIGVSRLFHPEVVVEATAGA